jgi:asparagine synthase (glutamine-hydrolysing)
VLDGRCALERHLAWMTERRPALRTRLYGPRLAEVVRRNHADDLRRRVGDRLAMSVPGGLMHLDQARWLPDVVLARSDRVGVLASLQIRAPYLNRELAEFAGTVSPEVHLAGHGKALLRALLSDVLPADGAPRTGNACHAPAAQWLRGPLASVLAHQLDTGCLYREGWMNAAVGRELAVEHAGGRRDHSHVLWPLLALGLWLDRRRGHDGI